MTDLMHRRIPGPFQESAEGDPDCVPLLREMGNTIALIPHAFAGYLSIDEYQKPPEEIPPSGFLAADVFANPEHFRFALRGCLAVSAGYVTYNLLDWGGMGVSVMLTCFSTAFSTIGTSRQRQVLRVRRLLGGWPVDRDGRPGF